MKLVACLAVWNEAVLIADSLRSVKAYVDRYVVVDSVFSHNPVQGMRSTDNTRAICERICSPLPLTYLTPDRKMEQDSARNLYIDALDDDDWGLVIDGDEVLCGAHSDVLATVGLIKTGNFPESLAVRVYSSGVLFHGNALDVPEDTYETAPVVHSVGWQARFFRSGRWRYRRNALGIAHGLYDSDGMFIGKTQERTDGVFLINRHVAQPWTSYQHDYIWETEQRRNP